MYFEIMIFICSYIAITRPPRLGVLLNNSKKNAQMAPRGRLPTERTIHPYIDVCVCVYVHVKNAPTPALQLPASCPRDFTYRLFLH